MDKLTQAYALCVLDYEFHTLDNAFLVHKPGIKKATEIGQDWQRAYELISSLKERFFLSSMRNSVGTRIAPYSEHRL